MLDKGRNTLTDVTNIFNHYNPRGPYNFFLLSSLFVCDLLILQSLYFLCDDYKYELCEKPRKN